MIHAGNLTEHGTRAQVRSALNWLAALPHPRKIVVAGSNDVFFQEHPTEARSMVPYGIRYLEAAMTVIHGLLISGAPWVPQARGMAFELPPAQMAEEWARISPDIDVLITHTPPAGVLDDARVPGQRRVGCEHLASRLPALTRLRLHVFGHVPASRGIVPLSHGMGAALNASCARPVGQGRLRPPIIVDL